LTALAAVAVIAVGVTQLPRIRETSATASQRQGVCTAGPDAALSAELRHPLAASRQQSVSVIGLSPNHAVLYLMTTTAGFHGIAAESVATGAISQEILNFEPANLVVTSAAGGLGPDGDVVFSTTLVEPWGVTTAALIAWSPKAHAWSPWPYQQKDLGPTGQGGFPMSAPVFSGPANQLVAWEASDQVPNSDRNGSTRQIYEADLLTGVTDVVASGYVGAPVFVGDTLVWPVASSPAGPYHLVAASASTFPAEQQVAVPLPLRQAGSATVIASRGGATVYASAGLTKLFYSPSLSQPARQVLQLPAGSHLSDGGLKSGGIDGPSGLAVGPGYLAWNTSAGASYVASAKTLAATRITDGTATWGAVQGLGGWVLASRSGHPESVTSSLYLMSASVIHGLTCAGHGG
jgi:hypothetical protein